MNHDLEIAKKAAYAGLTVIHEFKEKGINIREKGFHDLVTDADVAAEKAILSIIEEHFPDDDILAEESADFDSMTRKRTWVVDPIDGTTNFAHDFPIFCVSVALWENQKPKVGVVIEANRQEVFTAVAGKGAWLNDEPISVSKKSKIKRGFIATGFPYNDLSLVEPYIDLFRVLMRDLQGIRRPGAASYDLCCVACGRFDAFYEYSLHVWDVAAAALIIREAGGIVTDWNGEEGWAFGQRMIAGNKHFHEYLLHQIKKYIPAESRKNVG